MRGLALALVVCGCSADPITEVMVVVGTDLSDLMSVQILVSPQENAQKELFKQCNCVGSLPGCAALPAKLGLVPGGGSISRSFRVKASGYSDAGCGTFLVDQTATLQFYEHHTLELDLNLLTICKDKVCDPGSTCYDDGQCRSDQQSSTSLPPYNPNAKPDAGANGPMGRQWGAMAYDPVRGKTVLFGGLGMTDADLMGDTWEWDGTRWQPGSSTNGPPRRFHSAMAFDPVRRKLVLYGGLYTSELYTYDGTWTKLPATPGHGPEYPVMAYDSRRQQLTIFDELGETLVEQQGFWNSLTTVHTPTLSSPPGFAYYSGTGQIILFDDEMSGPTWFWDGTDWTQQTLTGPMPTGGTAMVEDTHAQSLVLYMPKNATWEWINGGWRNDNIPGPPPRSDAQIAYDSARQTVVLFGGYDFTNNILYDDTWELGPDRVWRQR
jgi:hypothetical protein